MLWNVCGACVHGLQIGVFIYAYSSQLNYRADSKTPRYELKCESFLGIPKAFDAVHAKYSSDENPILISENEVN